MSTCDPSQVSQKENFTSWATCPSTPNSPIQNTTTAPQESYGGSDVSWPNLLPINVGQDYDPSTSTNLFLVLPCSYIDSSTKKYNSLYQGHDMDFKTVCQGTDPLNSSYPFPVLTSTITLNSCYSKQTLDSQDYAGLGPQSDTLIEGSLEYLSAFQDPTTNYVSPPNDSDFKVTTSNYFQYYFSASVPGNVYRNQLLETKKKLILGSSSTSSTCNANATMTKCTTTEPNAAHLKYFKNLSISDQFDPKSLFIQQYAITTETKATYGCLSGYGDPGANNACDMGQVEKTQQSGTTTMALYAHMRDGQKRLTIYGNPYKDMDWSNSAGCNCCVYYRGSLWTPTTLNQNYNTMSFPKNVTTCVDSNNSNNPKLYANYLLDMEDANTARSKSYSLQLNSNVKNVYFAETVQDGKNTLVKSFNIRGRYPGCLSHTQTYPDVSASNISDSNKYLKVGATLSSQAKEFTFVPAMYLGGKGYEEIHTGKSVVFKYIPDNGPLWDGTSGSTFQSWPSIDALRNNKPDIVVRIMFYNPHIFDPTKTLDDLPFLTQDAIKNFQAYTLDLFQQNTPNYYNTSDTLCNTLFVHPFERGVAFLEYITTIVYSLMYGFNLDTLSLQGLYYDVSYNLYMPTGTYTMTDFLKHIFNRMDNLKIDTIVPRPTLFNSNKNQTVQVEFNAWVNEVLTNTDKYLMYPTFHHASTLSSTSTKSSDSDSTLYIKVHVHPMMHANIQTNNQHTLDKTLSIYLNNFFQDYTNQVGESSRIGNTKSFGVIGNVMVDKNNIPYKGPSAILIQLANTQQIDTLTLESSTQTYAISYIYQAQVTVISVGALLYLLQNNNTFNINLTDIPTNNNPSLPIFILDNYTHCLNQTPITQGCIDVLCKKGDCACDFSVTVGIQKTLNPQNFLYMNTSNKSCLCLAPNSYPKSISSVRALNAVGMCFSKACESINLPIKNPTFCKLQGCSSLIQAIHENNKNDLTWFDIFPDNGKGMDLNKINNMCGTNLQLGVAPTSFDINWYIVGGSVCMALAAPLALALDYYGMRQRRAAWAYWFWLIIIIVMFMLAGLLFYSLSGVYKCNSLQYVNTTQAGCYDRLTESIPLTRDACYPHLPLFCQCDDTGAPCTDYVDKSKPYQAQCMENGACAFCPNNTNNLDIITNKKQRISIPTTWAFLAFGVWCVISGLVCITLGSYFKNLGLNTIQRIGMLIAVGICIAFIAFGGLVAGTNHIQTNSLSIDIEAQERAAMSQSDPCS